MLRPILFAAVSAPLFCACMVDRDYSSHADGLDAMSLPTGALVVEQTDLAGDIGPVLGLRGESVGSGMRDQGFAQIRVDGETADGTAFVVFYMDDIGQLRNLRGQGPTTLRADSVEQPISAQGCSDTFDGDHYDAAAEEVTLDVEQTDDETLTVDYEVAAQDGNLTESPEATSATGTFALQFSEG
jgi:hypothetical protein